MTISDNKEMYSKQRVSIVLKKILPDIFMLIGPERDMLFLELIRKYSSKESQLSGLEYPE